MQRPGRAPPRPSPPSRSRIQRRGASSRAQPGSPARRRRRGIVRAHGSPERWRARSTHRPGGRIASSAAPFACAKPCAIASPSPLPRLGTRPCSNGSKIRSSSPSFRPGPRSTTRTTTRPSSCSPVSSTGASGENLSALSIRFDEHVLDLGAVDLDRVEVHGKRDRDALRASAELGECLADERLDRPQLGFWLGRSELQAREVEEVRDETIETPRLGVDRGEQAPRGHRRSAPGRSSRARRSRRGSRSTASAGRG